MKHFTIGRKVKKKVQIKNYPTLVVSVKVLLQTNKKPLIVRGGEKQNNRPTAGEDGVYF